MIQVTMNKDIRDYETKLFGTVTVRQAILLGIGLAYSVPIAIAIPNIDIAVRITIGFVCMLPVILMGWIQVYGMKMEQFIWQTIKSGILCPKNRKFIIEPSEETLVFEEQNSTSSQKIKISPDFPAHR